MTIGTNEREPAANCRTTGLRRKAGATWPTGWIYGRRTSVRDAPSAVRTLMAFTAGFIAMSALLYMRDSLGLALFITSWASSTALILSAWRDETIAPSTVFIAHILCGVMGCLVLSLEMHGIWIPALAFGAAFAFMQCSGRMHPPAAANVVIPIFTPIAWNQWLVAVGAGALSLALLACAAGAGRSSAR